MTPALGSGRLAAALRGEFDAAFAMAQSDATDLLVDVLEIRVGGDSYALPLKDVAAIAVGRSVTILPGAPSECLGIASVRGALVPVYDLRPLLGQPTDSTPRWLVVAAARPVALAFDAFDGHLRLSPEAMTPAGGEESARPHLHGAVRAAGRTMPIVATAAILETIMALIPHDSPPQE